MSFAPTAPKLLAITGLLAIVLSVILDANFARDTAPPPAVPEPATATLLAIGGVSAIATGVIRRRRK